MRLDPSLTTFPTALRLSRAIWDTLTSSGGSRHVERIVIAAALPAPLAHTVAEVARRTHLWPSEKRDVARELIAHVHDGLAAGATPESLLESFGEITPVARLIRRAKKRGRPWPWRGMVRTFQAIGLVMVLTLLAYTALAVRYWSGSPIIARDFIAEQNARVAAVPESLRAWPLYRRAILSKVAMPEILTSNQTVWPALTPDRPDWPAAVAYIDAMREPLALVRRAAELPELGQAWSTQMDLEMVRYLTAIHGGDPGTIEQPSAGDNSLIGVLLPHLGELRSFARDLAFSMRFNASRGDGTAVLADAQALLGMGEQMRGESSLITELVGLAVFALAESELGRLIALQPALFSDEQLIALAHQHSAWGGGGRLKPGSFADMEYMEDTLQRMYTDDGHGDGRFTHEGLRWLESFGMLKYDMIRTQMRDTKAMAAAAGPVVMQLVASRAEQRRMYEHLRSLGAQDAADMPWERASPTRLETAMKQFEGPGRARSTYAPVLALTPAWNRLATSFDSQNAQRDVLLAAIACEIYKRRTGAWPATLAELCPALLPAVPIDPWNGKAINYRVIDGSPIMYSVGPDRVDHDGLPMYHNTTFSLSTYTRDAKGDWRLWPPVD